MSNHRVVIGCVESARAAELAHAVAARSNKVVVAEVGPLERAIAAGSDVETAVVVLDGYPAGAALSAMADVTTARPELGVLVIGPLEPDLEVLIAVASGAFGYLPSRCSSATVADAVATLLVGDAVLPRAVLLPLVQHLRWGGRGIAVHRSDGRTVVLTNREWEVLVLLRQSRSTAEIAGRLVISNGTVRSHVAALLHKLSAVNRSDLTVTDNNPPDSP